MKGTILNTATVAIGASIGLTLGRFIPSTYESVAMEGLGLVVCLIGVKMSFQSKNAVVTVVSVVLGGLIGTALGIAPALDRLAEGLRTSLGGGSTFNEALISTSVLFCVGPMTLLGCLQDGVEGNTELLIVKSTLDGVASIFFAATLGVGVLVTAAVLFIVQASITLLARRLQWLAKDENLIAEATAVGGVLILGIGLGLLTIKKIRMETYLPALLLAPVFAAVAVKVTKPNKVTA